RARDSESLRRGHLRRHAPPPRWTFPDRGATEARATAAGPDSLGPSERGRPGARPSGRRRRLPGQAVRLFGTAGAAPRSAAETHGGARADEAFRRRSLARSADPGGDARGPAPGAAAPRVRSPRVPDAQPGPRGDEDRDPLARLELPLPPQDERRGCARLAA